VRVPWRSFNADLEYGEHHGTVFYVTAAAFAGYGAELDQLSEIVGGIHQEKRVADLRSYEVIGFIEREIVASPWLTPAHAAELGQPRRPM